MNDLDRRHINQEKADYKREEMIDEEYVDLCGKVAKFCRLDTDDIFIMTIQVMIMDEAEANVDNRLSGGE